MLGAYLSEAAAAMIGVRPLVLVDGYSAAPGRFAIVGTNNVDGATQATQHLLDLGHRRVALAGTTSDAFPSILERRQGYTEAMASAGLDAIMIDGHHDEPDVVAAKVAAALAECPSITGIVAANDEVALALLADLAPRVPNDISVIGFDDIEAASHVRPRLDTVSVDKPAMGRLAVAILRHRIEHPDDPAFVAAQQVRLVRRGSTAPPPGYQP